MQNNIDHKDSLLGLNLAIMYIYIIYCFTPLLYNYNIIGFLIISAWFVTASAMSGMLSSILTNKYNVLLYVWLFYVVFLKVIGYSGASWGNYFIYFSFFVSFIMYKAYDKVLSDRQKQNLLIFALIVIGINLADNIRLIILNPKMVEVLNFQEGEEFRHMNIGNTVYSLLWLMFTVILFWYFLFIRRSALVLLFIVAGVVYPYLASKTTAMLILAVCCGYVIIARLFFRFSKFWKVTGMAAVAVFLLFAAKEMYLYIVNMIGNEYIAARITDLGSLDFDSQYLERVGLAILSLNSFLSSPVFGVGFQKVDFSGNFSLLYSSGIGHHSELIDHLARYGLVGAAAYYLLYSAYMKNINMISGDKNILVLVRVVLFGFVLFSVGNNSFLPYIGLFVFVIFPLFIEMVNKQVSANECN